MIHFPIRVFITIDIVAEGELGGAIKSFRDVGDRMESAHDHH
jgi:hypothetical protein